MTPYLSFPSRMVVGEVRAEEGLDLLLARNSGCPAWQRSNANSRAIH